MRTRLLLVDDHAPFREMARELLALEGFDVVGEAADGRAGLAVAAALRPEVVLLDVQLPDLDGFVVAGLLAAEANAPAIILVSCREADDYGDQLTETPHPFITKGDLSGAALVAALAAAD